MTPKPEAVNMGPIYYDLHYLLTSTMTGEERFVYAQAYDDLAGLVAVQAAEIARLTGDLNVALLQRDAKLCSECPRTDEIARLEARVAPAAPSAPCQRDSPDRHIKPPLCGRCGREKSWMGENDGWVRNNAAPTAQPALTCPTVNANVKYGKCDDAAVASAVAPASGEAKRYRAVPNGASPTLEPYASVGTEFVRASDYDELQRSLARLTREAADLAAEVDLLRIRATVAEGELARLTGEKETARDKEQAAIRDYIAAQFEITALNSKLADSRAEIERKTEALQAIGNAESFEAIYAIARAAIGEVPS